MFGYTGRLPIPTTKSSDAESRVRGSESFEPNSRSYRSSKLVEGEKDRSFLADPTPFPLQPSSKSNYTRVDCRVPRGPIRWVAIGSSREKRERSVAGFNSCESRIPSNCISRPGELEPDR